MNFRLGHKKYYINIFFLLLLLGLLFGIISNPSLSLQSASQGILVWFNIILPSLLPFFIISEMLIGLGFIDILGKLLKPIMLPIFNTSGEGIFPLSMSILSGYPVGTKLTSRLREKKLISREEGNRLLCFTSSSGPIFMIGALAVGMLGDSRLGTLIIIPHYISMLILGLIFRFYKYKKRINNQNITPREYYRDINNSIISWINTKKSISSLIANSIKESMDALLLIGGIVIFYSVVIEILFNINTVSKLLNILDAILPVEKEFIKGIIVGLFEMTMGCKIIAHSNAPILNKLLIINFIVGWGGLSVHSQALHFINRTDLNGKLFMISKILHGLFSSILSYIFYIAIYKNYVHTTYSNNVDFISPYNFLDWFSVLINSSKLLILNILYISIISIITFLFICLMKKTN